MFNLFWILIVNLVMSEEFFFDTFLIAWTIIIYDIVSRVQSRSTFVIFSTFVGVLTSLLFTWEENLKRKKYLSLKNPNISTPWRTEVCLNF